MPMLAGAQTELGSGWDGFKVGGSEWSVLGFLSPLKGYWRIGSVSVRMIPLLLLICFLFFNCCSQQQMPMAEYFVPPAPPPPPPVIPSAQTAFDSPISAPPALATSATASMAHSSYAPSPPPAPPCPYSASPPQTGPMGPPVAPPPPPPGPPTVTASPAHSASPPTVTVEPRKPQIPLIPMSDARSDLLAAIRRGELHPWTSALALQERVWVGQQVLLRLQEKCRRMGGNCRERPALQRPGPKPI